jgi:indolepyruvate ferredoxin oxidoreductase alpha subunit
MMFGNAKPPSLVDRASVGRPADMNRMTLKSEPTTTVTQTSLQLLSGNEAVALAARQAGVALGSGYPGTPSTEILEYFDALGGKAQWAPNEKVAFEVALGAAFGTAGALVTMKHVGLNVAADPLFTAAYTGVAGPLIVVSADDPGMASSQNEQDNRRYAVAAGVPMLEPADSQEAYDFMLAALEISARWHQPVLLRMTTRVCHSKTLVKPHPPTQSPGPARFDRDIAGRVMIPLNARPAHHRLRAKLAEMAAWNETSVLNTVVEGRRDLGIITSNVTYVHVREALPDASVLKLGMTYPLPLERIRAFAESVDRCVVIEEGDPYLFEQIRAAGVPVEQKQEMYRFGEMNVARVKRIVANDTTPEPKPARGKPPALCVGCPHRDTFGVLRKLDCIVSGDIGCYSLGVLPPIEAMDSLVCMGASIGMGLGLRHVLPEDQARRVVSVLGDSTFIHSGITGLAEMVYNPPATGHVVVILDNSTTAMTGLQEHPGTGRTLGYEPTNQVVLEDVARSFGVQHVVVLDPHTQLDQFEATLRAALQSNELTVIIARRPCLLAAAKAKKAKAEEERKAKLQEEICNAPDSSPVASGTQAGNATPQGTAFSRLPVPADAPAKPVSIVIAGLGGQGVIKASDILSDAAFLAGYDVKKSEIHGMSQRGGSVASDIRFGRQVLSPMVPPGDADFLLVLAADQVENNRARLGENGVLIAPDALPTEALPNRRSENVAMLGVLSRSLNIDMAAWTEAIRRNLKPELFEANCQAFELGRQAAMK